MFSKIAVVGATGAVGSIIRELLEKRNFPAKEFVFLASPRSAGTTLTFQGKPHTVQALTKDCFSGIDLVIASTPDETAAEFVPYAIEAGCKVIDESGYFRMRPDVALVMPEINPQDALNAKGIIASPNCSTTQMVMALKPLHDISPITRVVVSTYQATSGAGVQGTAELHASSAAFLKNEPFEAKIFQYPIGFNAIPQIGGHKEAGYTSEEMKMVYETRKIMGLPNLPVSATCVRIPVANCHSEVINVETEKPISVEEARAAFTKFPGVTVIDDLPNKQYPTPSASNGSDEVFIGRIRKDISHPSSLTFWCVSDNLRKGAATNAVQIAELLAKHHN
jgi:aspartate-semialdehyde dehydrogenase